MLGGNYYGYIMADRVNASNIAVVNLVSADDYVACVVGSEMYASWPIEALKAQAVIARTYAMTVSSYDKYGIDVTDDTRTQAYKGTAAETDATRRAAAETSGKVVLYNGKPRRHFSERAAAARRRMCIPRGAAGKGSTIYRASKTRTRTARMSLCGA